MLSEEVEKRLKLIKSIQDTFKERIESSLPIRFQRGPLQDILLKIYRLPKDGAHQRLINEAIQKLGYKKISIKGKMYFRKFKSGENRAGREQNFREIG